MPNNISRFIIKNWVAFFLAGLVLVFGAFESNFLSLRNLNNIFIASTALLLLATGQTYVIISGGIDLSIGFVMGLTSVTSAMVMKMMYANGSGYPELICIGTGILTGLTIGLLPGLINGLLVALLRVPPFIATLGMYGIANGVALKICGGFPVSFLPPLAGQIGNGYLAYYSPKAGLSFFTKPVLTEREDILALVRIVPVSVLITMTIILVFGFILSKTQFGRHIYVIGGNMEAGIRSGINVKKHLIKIYTISSFLASCAGVILVMRFTMGSHTSFSASYELFAIAGVVIGGASLMGGAGNITGTVIGILLLGVMETGFVMTGIEVFYRYIAVGSILIFAVMVDQLFPDFVYKK